MNTQFEHHVECTDHNHPEDSNCKGDTCSLPNITGKAKSPTAIGERLVDIAFSPDSFIGQPVDSFDLYRVVYERVKAVAWREAATMVDVWAFQRATHADLLGKAYGQLEKSRDIVQDITPDNVDMKVGPVETIGHVLAAPLNIIEHYVRARVWEEIIDQFLGDFLKPTPHQMIETDQGRFAWCDDVSAPTTCETHSCESCGVALTLAVAA